MALEFLLDMKSTIILKDPRYLPQDWHGDCHVMPQALSQQVHIPNPHMSKPNLQKFNLCHIYLQILTLSNIATSSGNEIDSHF